MVCYLSSIDVEYSYQGTNLAKIYKVSYEMFAQSKAKILSFIKWSANEMFKADKIRILKILIGEQLNFPWAN